MPDLTRSFETLLTMAPAVGSSDALLRALERGEVVVRSPSPGHLTAREAIAMLKAREAATNAEDVTGALEALAARPAEERIELFEAEGRHERYTIMLCNDGVLLGCVREVLRPRVKLDVFSAPVREAIATLERERDRWSSDGYRPAGLLADAIDAKRYGNVPPEAFPVLDLGVDGCHYALWIDDAAQTFPPCAVFVCPADPTPETVQLVAANAHDLVTLLRGGYFRDDPELAAALAARAIDARAARIAHRTADGLGVACDDPAAAHALAEVRDRIALDDATGIDGFGAIAERAYRALGRTLHAEIAARSYARDAAVAALVESFFAKRSE